MNDRVPLSNLFQPAPAAWFEFANVTSRVGHFQNIELATLLL